MLSLNNIGFYTLDDNRCKNASVSSRLMRCELILTDVCTFKCPYCRGLKKELTGTMSLKKLKTLLIFGQEITLKIFVCLVANRLFIKILLN